MWDHFSSGNTATEIAVVCLNHCVFSSQGHGGISSAHLTHSVWRVCVCILRFKNTVMWKVKCASKSPSSAFPPGILCTVCVGKEASALLTRLGEQQAIHHLQILPEGLLRLRGSLQARAASVLAATLSLRGPKSFI